MRKYWVYFKRFLRATKGYPGNFFYIHLRPSALKWKWHYAFNIQPRELDMYNEHKFIKK